jgi:hypothetical protein
MGFPGNNWTACSVHRFFHPAIPKFPKIKTKELLKHQSQLTIFCFFPGQSRCSNFLLRVVVGVAIVLQ